MTRLVPDAAHGMVKICGLRDVGAAMTAARAGADLLSFILADSRRKVAPDLISEVRLHLETMQEERPLLVGVTVNSGPREIAEHVDRGQMDIVQLSGDETREVLDDIDVPAIKTVHVEQGMPIEDLRRNADAWLDHPRPVVALLIEGRVAGHYGGTGIRTDWPLAALLVKDYPVMLAGGLKPGNVAEGISAVRPSGVDVSSGVEIDGEKDYTLIESFVARARQSFAEQH